MASAAPGPGLIERAFAGALEPLERPDDEISTRILDAAYDHFTRYGFRRATMDDVARRAGVSRITVYRRFANRDALVEHVVRREFQRYFAQFLVDIARADDAAGRVVAGFVSSVRTIRANPLIGELTDATPETAPVLLSDQGRTLALVSRFVADQLRREQRAGHVAAGVDVDRAGEMMVRVAASFLVFPSRLIDLDDEDELAAVAREFLVPMLDQRRSA